MRKLTSFPILSVLLCGVTYLALSCCKEPAKLPPSAGAGFKEAKIFCSYKGWPFGEQAYKHTEVICDLGPRPIESSAHKKTQAYISSKLSKFGWTVKKQKFEATTPYGPRKFTNIIARKKVDSSQTQSPDILLAAHYESKKLDGFVGADDAASCVGALLEIAEFLPKVDPALANRIELVFFDGEEALKKNIVPKKDGLYGSLYYSSYLNKDVTSTKANYSKRPKFGILLDMIGHKNLSVKIPGDTPYGLMKSYFKVVEKHRLSDQFGVAGGPIIDDHLFMNELAKVPTIDIIGDFGSPSNNWWHTNGDNFSNISSKSLSTSIQLTLELMRDYDARK